MCIFSFFHIYALSVDMHDMIQHDMTWHDMGLLCVVRPGCRLLEATGRGGLRHPGWSRPRAVPPFHTGAALLVSIPVDRERRDAFDSLFFFHFSRCSSFFVCVCGNLIEGYYVNFFENVLTLAWMTSSVIQGFSTNHNFPRILEFSFL